MIKVNHSEDLEIVTAYVFSADLYFQDKNALREDLKWKCTKEALPHQNGVNKRKPL